MTPTAYGDESVHHRHVIMPMYLIGVCITSLAESEIRRILEPLKHSGDSKLHWSTLRTADKIQVMDILSSLFSNQRITPIIIQASPLPTSGKQEEHARRKCLEQLIPGLEGQHDIHNLLLESRSKAQDEREVQFVKQLRCKHWIPNDFRISHQPGHSNAGLWLPDQILGAYGDAAELLLRPQLTYAERNFLDTLNQFNECIDVIHCDL
ncbi:hypothetical protein [Bifidobacterium cebidarum]|uniref:DUF3800 domain-containing protein n=1 Tax=Bifidobacterium cebidarum TaxID=2650773 RepID=A0A6I1GEC3_9BIFI|nr:hypothetical protein [Bifidobacterium cebidarum]KAB7786981.1 hypothetical protein F7D08_1577 [Bifidobacterium cebidarum]